MHHFDEKQVKNVYPIKWLMIRKAAVVALLIGSGRLFALFDHVYKINENKLTASADTIFVNRVSQPGAKENHDTVYVDRLVVKAAKQPQASNKKLVHDDGKGDLHCTGTNPG